MTEKEIADTFIERLEKIERGLNSASEEAKTIQAENMYQSAIINIIDAIQKLKEI